MARILHTADWHLGKVLKGVARLDEQRAVLGDIVGISADEGVELVVVAGDIFESAAPAPDAQQLAWETVLALRRTGAQVVLIAGNHDSAAAFDAVRPVFEAAGIVVLGAPRPPPTGGVLSLTAARSGHPIHVGLLPFVSQRGVVRASDLFDLTAADGRDRYAERVGRIIARLCEGFAPGTVNLLVAHGTVTGARFGGGEREAQSVFDYHVPATVFPASASYVALGHLHRAQAVPAPCPAWYAGSPIAVDFGEEAGRPQVNIIDAAPGVPARVRGIELTSARRLRTVSGTVAELAAMADDIGDALLRVEVAEPARAGLADEVRAVLPNAIDIKVARPTDRRTPVARAGRTATELFHEYLLDREVADPRLEVLFAELLDVTDEV